MRVNSLQKLLGFKRYRLVTRAAVSEEFGRLTVQFVGDGYDNDGQRRRTRRPDGDRRRHEPDWTVYIGRDPASDPDSIISVKYGISVFNIYWRFD